MTACTSQAPRCMEYIITYPSCLTPTTHRPSYKQCWAWTRRGYDVILTPKRSASAPGSPIPIFLFPNHAPTIDSLSFYPFPSNSSPLSYPLTQLLVGKDQRFTFDHVFSQHARQEDLYQECVGPLVAAHFDGYNATILAYGQTGSGTTSIPPLPSLPIFYPFLPPCLCVQTSVFSPPPPLPFQARRTPWAAAAT